MHEHVSVSHEKYGFNKHLRKYRFCRAEVDSSVKNKVLAVLWKQNIYIYIYIYTYTYIYRYRYRYIYQQAIYA